MHRDVKPSNVLVADDGRVVLTDFGVVKDLEDPDITAAGTVIGTVAFAAPEQMVGERIDPRTDLFGLACAHKKPGVRAVTPGLYALDHVVPCRHRERVQFLQRAGVWPLAPQRDRYQQAAHRLRRGRTQFSALSCE